MGFKSKHARVTIDLDSKFKEVLYGPPERGVQSSLKEVPCFSLVPNPQRGPFLFIFYHSRGEEIPRYRDIKVIKSLCRGSGSSRELLPWMVMMDCLKLNG